MSKSQPTKTIVFPLPLELVEWFDDLARDNGVSRAWLLRQVLHGFRDALDAEVASEAKRPEPQIGLAAVRPRRSSPDNDHV